MNKDEEGKEMQELRDRASSAQTMPEKEDKEAEAQDRLLLDFSGGKQEILRSFLGKSL